MIRTSSSQGSQISGEFTQAPQFCSYALIKHLALLAAQPEASSAKLSLEQGLTQPIPFAAALSEAKALSC